MLVYFPLLTGGVWVRRPGLFIELSDLGAPVAIVGVLALLLKHRGVSIERASSVRVAKWAFGLWSAALTQTPARALAAVSLGMGCLWSLASLRRHWAFESHSFDLGIFTNAIWNLVHGFGYVSAPKDGLNLFADHQSPIFWALAPVFAVFQSPETLLVLQGVLLAAGAIPLFFLARQTLGSGHWAGAALPLLYWANRPIRNANAFDFHPEVLMLPLFLAAIAGLQSRSKRARTAGALALLAALACKESAGPVAAGVGLAWMLGAGAEATRTFTRKVGGAVMLLGAGVFLFDVLGVPSFFGSAYAYTGLYSSLGSSLGEIALSPLLRPGAFWPLIFGGARLKFLFWTLAPLGFLPLLNARAIPAFLPGYLMLFLSATDHRVNLIYHYAIEPSVGLLWAMPGAIAIVERRQARLALQLPLWLLFWALAAFGRSELYRVRANSPDAHQAWLSRRLIPCVRGGIAIAASDSLVPHLATRHWAHNLTRLETDLRAEPVSCVLTDSSVGNWPMSNEEFQALTESLPALGYRLAYHCRSLQVFEKGEPGASCLSCIPECTEDTER